MLFEWGKAFSLPPGLWPGVRLDAGWKPGGSTEVLPHELSGLLPLGYNARGE